MSGTLPRARTRDPIAATRHLPAAVESARRLARPQTACSVPSSLALLGRSVLLLLPPRNVPPEVAVLLLLLSLLAPPPSHRCRGREQPPREAVVVQGVAIRTKSTGGLAPLLKQMAIRQTLPRRWAGLRCAQECNLLPAMRRNAMAARACEK